ncbi:hypothetical protein ASPBRDRAFT_129539 [Aspergillus brasiliensis CBS 101740]|uniref:Cucumopine synthase C-terminal helical bundle domain-containing protein n=1 Tax=Aspergillus brasiliensis (strain CBS 101740 / IMI 381727 / IBT 21946) TaxID=767769 RepID=A0A1L9UEL1_ASPBC|nr:hypothetical protein ASPBRDRAFT_129539 [Aspergillus brasiliensis CBS 101740]
MRISNGSQAQAPSEIKIKWPRLNTTITVKMKDANPTLVSLLGSALPYRSLQTHAVVAGDQLYHLVPLEQLIVNGPSYRPKRPIANSAKCTPADKKAPDRAKEPDGSVFLSSFQHFVIKYGEVTEHQPVATCGKVIDEDMEKLRWVADEIWKFQCETRKHPIEVVLWDASKPEPDPDKLDIFKGQRAGVSKQVKNLVHEIHTETQKYWSDISEGIERTHHGKAPERPGSKDSYLGAMVFSNSVVRTLGYHILDNIIKLAFTRPEFTLGHLIVLFRDFIPSITDFVAHLGAEYVNDSYERIDRLIKEKVESNPNQEEAREDFLAMISALGFYVNLLNAQNLHMFPWRHAKEYPIG